MKRVGFTGTRAGLTPRQADTLGHVLRERFEAGAEIHHGDCLGADASAHALAKAIGYKTVGHPCTLERWRAHCDVDDEWPALEPLARNRVIVDNTDFLLACPQGPEERRSGTWATIRHARRHGVPVIIIWPDGRAERELLGKE